MYQNETGKNLKKLVAVIFLASCFSACSKKPSGVRSQVKSQQTNLNPGVSSQADQQAASVGMDYKISTVSVPNPTDSGNTVDVQLLSPSGEYLPLTTRHENGNLDAYGVYNDSAKGVQVQVQARCSADDCFKYTFISTVIKNNQKVYQAVAISYKNDCKFNIASSSFSAGQFVQSLAEAENKYQVFPVNDIETCPQ